MKDKTFPNPLFGLPIMDLPFFQIPQVELDRIRAKFGVPPRDQITDEQNKQVGVLLDQLEAGLRAIFTRDKKDVAGAANAASTGQVTTDSMKESRAAMAKANEDIAKSEFGPLVTPNWYYTNYHGDPNAKPKYPTRMVQPEILLAALAALFVDLANDEEYGTGSEYNEERMAKNVLDAFYGRHGGCCGEQSYTKFWNSLKLVKDSLYAAFRQDESFDIKHFYDVLKTKTDELQEAEYQAAVKELQKEPRPKQPDAAQATATTK